MLNNNARALWLAIGSAAILMAAVLALPVRPDSRAMNDVAPTVSATSIATITAIPPLTTLPVPLGNHPVYVLDTHNGGLLSDLHIIDSDARKDSSIVRLRYNPEIAFSPDGAKMYVLDSYYTQATRGDWREALSVFDAHTFDVLMDDVPVEDHLTYQTLPEGNLWFFPSPDDTYLFVVKVKSNTNELLLSVLEATTLQSIAEYRYPWCADNRVWALSGSRLFCHRLGKLYTLDARTGEGTSMIDLPEYNYEPILTLVSSKGDRWFRITSNAMVTSVNTVSSPPRVLVPDAQIQIPPEHSFGWSRHLAAAPDASRLYVAFLQTRGELFGSSLADVIWTYNTQTWQRVGQIRLRDPAWQIAVSNDGTQLYSVSPEKKTLSIFDTTTFTEIGQVRDLGESPAQILVPPATK